MKNLLYECIINMHKHNESFHFSQWFTFKYKYINTNLNN